MSHHTFEGEHGQIGTHAKTNDTQAFAINNAADNKLFDRASQSHQRAANETMQNLGFASGTELLASDQKFDKQQTVKPSTRDDDNLPVWRHTDGKAHRPEDNLPVWRHTDGQAHRPEDNLLLYHDWELKNATNPKDLLLKLDLEQKQEPKELVEPKRDANGIEQLSRFEGARPISLDDVPAEFKPNRADGSMQIVNSDGVFTFWPNGSANVRRFDGTGYAYNPDGKGGYEYKQWGKTDKDNFSSKYDKATDSLTEVDAKGTVITRWNNGSENCQRTDGSGYSKKYMDTHDYMTETKHWGPKPEDNYRQIYNVITKIGQIQGRKSS